MLSERVAIVTDAERAKHLAHFLAYFCLSPADSVHAREWIRAI
jgi:hypothetical protein